MLVPVAFHHVNNSLCFLLGYLTNSLLIYLIVACTPSEMRVYRPILLQSCVTDLVYLAVILLVQPAMLIDSGLTAIVTLGPLSWVGQPWNFALVAAWTVCYQFSQYSLVVPFVYRYVALCRGWVVGPLGFTALMGVPVFFALARIPLFYHAGYTSSQEEQSAGLQHFFPDDGNSTNSIGVVSTLGYYSRYRERNLIVVLYVMVASAAVYVVIVPLGWLIYRHLTAMAVPYVSATRARRMQQQLSAALLLQAALPLCLEFAPTIQLAVSTALGMQNLVGMSVYETALFAWLPVLNPLCAIWVVRAYRQRVLKEVDRVWRACGGRSMIAAGATSTAVGPAVMELTYTVAGNHTVLPAKAP